MKIYKGLILPVALFFMFLLLTIMILKVDVKPIGPMKSTVGLATINQFIFNKLGIHLIWYKITDWLGVVSILVAFGFGLFGFVQLIKRKSLLRVDTDIIFLGALYIIVIIAYIIFEIVIVNYRPIILYEKLESSFPSSHTMIVISIMGTVIIQLQKRISNTVYKIIIKIIALLVIMVTIVGRLLSGVHWFTDIVGGILLATSLILFYRYSVKWIKISNDR